MNVDMKLKRPGKDSGRQAPVARRKAMARTMILKNETFDQDEIDL